MPYRGEANDAPVNPNVAGGTSREGGVSLQHTALPAIASRF